MRTAIRNVLVEPDEATPAENVVAALVAEAANREAAPMLERYIAGHGGGSRIDLGWLDDELRDTVDGMHPDTVEHIFELALRESLKHEKDKRTGRWARSNPPDRDLKKAMKQIEETIWHQLSLTTPSGLKVHGLTDAIVRNLAAHILMSIDEYGR